MPGHRHGFRPQQRFWKRNRRWLLHVREGIPEHLRDLSCGIKTLVRLLGHQFGNDRAQPLRNFRIISRGERVEYLLNGMRLAGFGRRVP